jgi:hypothetical protein
VIRDLDYHVRSDVTVDQFVETILQSHPKTQEYLGKLKKMTTKRRQNVKMFYEDQRSGAIEQEKIDEERRKRRIQRFKDLLHVFPSLFLSLSLISAHHLFLASRISSLITVPTRPCGMKPGKPFLVSSPST